MVREVITDPERRVLNRGIRPATLTFKWRLAVTRREADGRVTLKVRRGH